MNGCRRIFAATCRCTVRATRAGVGRVHLISFEQDGALLRELFTHDGVGTVVTRESLENIREAKAG